MKANVHCAGSGEWGDTFDPSDAPCGWNGWRVLPGHESYAALARRTTEKHCPQCDGNVEPIPTEETP